ncbi:putative transcription factor C2H2 family [Helianthus annuus]|nr:putative transcription factor C2H2 family [Helianthus annuus]
MDDASQICALCRRTLSSENENNDFDSIAICGDCKFLFLEDNGTPSRHIQHRAPRTRQTRYHNSSESIEDMFSQQFSTMINLARQNPAPVSDTSSRTTPSGSRRWRRVVSDTESDGFDSANGDSDVISYGAYVDDSDVSVDAHSPLGGDSDTDIDPMHAGLNQWSSDDEWEAVEDGENGETLGSLITRVHLQRSMVYDGLSPEIEGAIRVRISESRLYPFGYTDNDQETSRYVGNSGDYLDSRSFEELLERLADADTSRRGAPPAAPSVVNNLDFVTVNASDHNGLTCAICKDSLTVGTVVNRLPCLHLYHPLCIKPWLSARNTCPLCRFELPTDDVDYENRKEIDSRGPTVQETQQELEVNNINNTSFEEDGGQEMLNNGAGGETRGRRWLFVAAPVVSLVGIGLALWLGNPGAIRSSGSRGDRSRRGWGLF